MYCPKCSNATSKGFVEPNIVFTNEGKTHEIRCLSCGWRPKELNPIGLNHHKRQRKWIFKKPHELKAA